MRLTVFALVLLIGVPLLAHAAPLALLPGLAHQCPDRHLDNMTNADLEGLMEDFEQRLTPAQKRFTQDLVGERCARIEAGVSCANAAAIDAYRRFHLLKPFARQVCTSGWTCHGFGECARTKP
jgi:hypothetical protein